MCKVTCRDHPTRKQRESSVLEELASHEPERAERVFHGVDGLVDVGNALLDSHGSGVARTRICRSPCRWLGSFDVAIALAFEKPLHSVSEHLGRER